MCKFENSNILITQVSKRENNRMDVADKIKEKLENNCGSVKVKQAIKRK